MLCGVRVAEPDLPRATPSAEPYLPRATPSAEPDLPRATPSAEPYLRRATPSAEPYLRRATPSAEPYLPRATPSAEPYLPRATPSAEPDLPRATPSAEQDLPRATPSAEPDLPRATPSAEPDLPRATPSAEPYLLRATPSAEPYLPRATPSAEPYLPRATPSAEPYLPRATPSAEPYLRRATPSAEPYLPRATPSAEPYLPRATPSAEPDLPRATPSAEQDLPRATPSAEPDLPRATPSAEPDLPRATPSAEPYLPRATPSAEPYLPRATPSAEPYLPRATPSAEPGPSQDHLYARQPVQGAAEVYGKSVRCPHCNLSLLKNNYNTHLLRRHADLSHDITQACHLQSVTGDETNGIFSVQKTGHGFSVPVHVQRKTWGTIHQVRCELEECVQYQLLAQRSGLSYSLCSHIRSVDYCSEIAAETFLGEDVLRDMIAVKHFGEAKAAICVKRQKAACAAHVPLCVPVDFGSQPTPAEPRSTESIAAQPPTDEAPTQNVGPSHHCGQHCATLTAISNLRPCRTMWAAGGDHPLQEQLVSYVLDEGRPANEIMIKDGPTCLTRENRLSLGLNREMDSMVGNACLRLVKEIVELQGKNVFIMDLHIPPTWLPPLSCDPLGSLPWEQGFGYKPYRDILRLQHDDIFRQSRSPDLPTLMQLLLAVVFF
ncbi:unnamed protein product [Leuciscus chuanchicus]